MKIDTDCVTSFFLYSPEGQLNLRNIADGASTTRALSYVLQEFRTSADARRRIRAAIRSTDFYKVMCRVATQEAAASQETTAAVPVKTEEEDWGPSRYYLPWATPHVFTIDWEEVPMHDVPHHAPRQVYSDDFCPDSLSWEEVSGLFWAVSSLAESAEEERLVAEEALVAELFSELPLEYPHAPAKKNVAAGFHQLFKLRSHERKVEAKGIIFDAISCASAARESFVLSAPAVNQVIAMASTSEAYEERLHQEETRESTGIGTLADLKQILAKRKAPLPRRKGKQEEFSGAGEGQFIPGGGLKLSEDDVFHVGSIVKRWMPQSQEPKKAEDIRVRVEHPVKAEMVRVPQGVDHSESIPIFKPLPRMTEDSLRKLLEKGWKGQTSVCCDLSIQSHVGYGVPIVVFVSLLDTRTTCAEEAYLTGAYLDIGRNKASMLSVPLINLPMGETIMDIDNFIGGLCLVFYYQHNRGFRPGIPLLSYGAIEFSEITASTNYRTKARDSWAEITKRNDPQGKRIVAGLNAIQTLEKDFNEPLPSLGEVKITVPYAAPEMPAYISQGRVVQPTLGRVQSFTVPSSRVPNTTGRLSFAGSRPPDEATGKRDAVPRHTAVPLGVSADPNYVYSERFKVDKDAKANTIVAAIDLRLEIETHRTRAWFKWWENNVDFPKFTFKVHTTRNGFIGAAFTLFVDWWGKLDPAKFTEIPPSVANELPGPIPITFRQDLHVFEWDTRKSGGCAFAAVGDFFSRKPMIYLCVGSTNQIVQAHDWFVGIEVFMESNPDTTWLGTPFCRFPITYGDYFPIERNFGPFSIKGSNPGNSLVRLNWAEKVDTGRGSTISPWRALLEHCQGFSGVLEATFIPCSSVMVGCKLRAGAWHSATSVPTIGDLCLQEHEDLENESKDFSLRLRSSTNMNQTGNSQCYLVFIPFSGVTAPDQHVKDFEFYVRIKGISDFVCGSPMLESDWMQFCLLTDFTADQIDFYFLSQINDNTSSGCKVTMAPSVISHLVSSTGLHGGIVDISITWAHKVKYGENEGCISFVHGYGSSPPQISGRAEVINNANGAFQADSMRIGQVGGANRSGDNQLNRWLRLHFEKATQLSEMRISIRPHDGFSFYGDSCAVPV